MFGEEGKILISVYSHVLGINENYVEDIISKNEIAKLFLEQESALKVTSDLENLEVLVRITIPREYGDLSRINSRDIEFIERKYNINIQGEHQEKTQEYSINEIMKIFEEVRGVDGTHDTISAILEDYDKEYANRIN